MIKIKNYSSEDTRWEGKHAMGKRYKSNTYFKWIPTIQLDNPIGKQETDLNRHFTKGIGQYTYRKGMNLFKMMKYLLQNSWCQVLTRMWSNGNTHTLLKSITQNKYFGKQFGNIYWSWKTGLCTHQKMCTRMYIPMLFTKTKK